MKKILLLLLTITAFTATNAQTTRKLKKVLELVMPGTDGSNGAAVVWNPAQKKYYAVFAGNETFPMAVFDVAGKEVSDGELTAGYDLRGMWYNPKTKAIEANCYDSTGWVTYKLDAKGLPGIPDIFLPGMNQPSSQSVATFNPKTNGIYFLSTDGISVYKMDGTPSSTLTLKKTATGDEIEFSADNPAYNNTTVIFTGIPKAELGVLNIEEKKIDLFSSSTGIFSNSWAIPDDVPLYSYFNFSYANGIVWFFDKDTRIWMGYK